jgi:hypothetical protein
VRSYTAEIPTDVSVSYIRHDLGTYDVHVEVYRLDQRRQSVIPVIDRICSNSVRVIFGALTEVPHRVIVTALTQPGGGAK